MADCGLLIQIFWPSLDRKATDTEETTTEYWKSIPCYFFKKFGGLNFLLRCNYDFKFLEKSGIPIFYRKILANFLEIRNLYQHHNGQDLILFNNKDILIDGNSFFLTKMERKGRYFNSRHLGQ